MNHQLEDAGETWSLNICAFVPMAASGLVEMATQDRV